MIVLISLLLAAFGDSLSIRPISSRSLSGLTARSFSAFSSFTSIFSCSGVSSKVNRGLLLDVPLLPKVNRGDEPEHPIINRHAAALAETKSL
jgi:hypothetical protein